MQGHGFDPWSGKTPHVTRQLSQDATATEPACLEPVVHNRRSPHMATKSSSPSLEPEKDCTQQQRPSTAKKILILKNASKVCGETESFMHQWVASLVHGITKSWTRLSNFHTHTHTHTSVECFPGGTSGKESVCQCRRCKRSGSYPWVGRNSWRRKWQPTPVFIPG